MGKETQSIEGESMAFFEFIFLLAIQKSKPGFSSCTQFFFLFSDWLYVYLVQRNIFSVLDWLFFFYQSELFLSTFSSLFFSLFVINLDVLAFRRSVSADVHTVCLRHIDWVRKSLIIE